MAMSEFGRSLAKVLGLRRLSPQSRAEDAESQAYERCRTGHHLSHAVLGADQGRQPAPRAVSYVAFNGAVNSGVLQSAKWLQRALGIKADGVIGPATLAAIRACQNHDALVDAICDRRLAFLRGLKTWKTFGKGWASRVAGVRSVGKAAPLFFIVSDSYRPTGHHCALASW
ncbi:hypothetical protein F3Y30_05605 [Sinorhizobium sp. BG8]|nr:hypothetical protein F3Y30_05605 [Sinorhizobium sp. BG8]